MRSESGQDSDREENKDEERDLSSFKVSQLIDFKQFVDEIYGEGVFEETVGDDIAAIVNFVNSHKNV